MPNRPPRACRCGQVHPAGARCPAAGQWTRPAGRTWSAGTNTRQWRALRTGILAETPLCRCGALAVEVDHRWPLEHGGPRWERWNLQALCTPCHLTKTARDRTSRRLVSSTVPYTVVCGPPCAGKATLVRRRAGRLDLVLDLDELYRSLLPGHRAVPSTGPTRDALWPFAIEARDAILDRLARPSDLAHAWVITGAPRRADRARFRGAELIVLATPASDCIRRARAARRPAVTADWIDAWWAAYEPE